MNTFISIDLAPFLVLIFGAYSASMVGSFLVLMRSSMLIDAIGHSVFLGIIVGILSFPISHDIATVIGGMIVASFMFTGVRYLSKYFDQYSNICILYNGSLGLGVLLVSIFNVDLGYVDKFMLYGDLDLIFWPEIINANSILDIDWTTIPKEVFNMIFASIVITIVFIFIMHYNTYATFDKIFTRIYSKKIIFMYEILTISLVSLVTVLLISTLGFISSISLFVLPGVISSVLFSDNFYKFYLSTGIISVSFTLISYSFILLCSEYLAFEFDVNGFISLFLFTALIGIVTLFKYNTTRLN